MNKAGMKLLEKAFAAEVENRLPFQARSELAHKLAKDGYLQPMETWMRSYAAGNLGPVLVKGWQLTHAGRLTYCMSCEKPSGPQKDGQ
jgi:hypothetical protein